MASEHPPSLTRLLLSTTPAAVVLVGVVIFSTCVLMYSQLSALGERWYPGYHELRSPPVEPDCDPEARLVPVAEEEDLFDGILEEAPAEKKKAAPESDEDAVLDDLLGEEEEGGGSLAAAKAAQANCRGRWEKYRDIQARRTDGVERFRFVESLIEAVRDVGLNYQRHALVFLILICAATATRMRHHIALRPARSRLDHRVSEGAQLGAMVLLTWSVWSHLQVTEAAGVLRPFSEYVSGLGREATAWDGFVHWLDTVGVYWIWISGFSLIGVLNLVNLLQTPANVRPGGRISGALLTVPLFTTMCLISGVYFLVAEDHPAGLSIYLGKLPEYAKLYLQVGLYVWIGMLLKRTRLAELVFDLIRPWKLPPELLAFVVVVGAALPTAYSGASGIFVIAVGAVVYEEMRRAGARRQLALATTAMSGSLGVVLRPCLLVVIVASLNKQVTTDQLYAWGFKVFLLTAVLFFIGAMLTRQGPLKMAPASVAAPATLRALLPLAPYVAIVAAILLTEAFVLDAYLDEFSAPYILPIVLLAILIYDRLAVRREAKRAQAPRPPGFVASMEMATSETTGHIGALLLLMGLSICLGGIVERAELMTLIPETFGSVWTTMGLLVVVLVLIGMTMDPYGAVILVSATVAAVAYRNGIDPVHFWMVVLVAFELGYLTPPVALNHLLTRQVVGDDEAEIADQEGDTFWSRHERVLLPVSVMATALIIVAFLPLLWY